MPHRCRAVGTLLSFNEAWYKYLQGLGKSKLRFRGISLLGISSHQVVVLLACLSKEGGFLVPSSYLKTVIIPAWVATRAGLTTCLPYPDSFSELPTRTDLLSSHSNQTNQQGRSVLSSMSRHLLRWTERRNIAIVSSIGTSRPQISQTLSQFPCRSISIPIHFTSLTPYMLPHCPFALYKTFILIRVDTTH